MPPKPWLYRQRLESLLKHRSVQDWLGRTPRKADFYIFQAYLKWRKEKGLDDDPDRWIDECLNGNNLTLVKHLRTLLEWAQGPSLDGLADVSRIRYYCVVRAFYRKNFVSLPEANIKVRREASEVSQQVTANQFDAMLRKVLEVGRLSVRDRAIMLTMRQGGMDDSTLALSFNFVGFPQLARHFGTPDPSRWDETRVPVKIDLVRPKTDYRYFTGLHRDAIAALKDYLAVRGVPRPRESHNLKSLPTSEPLFLSQTGGPISPEAVGVIYNESGKRAGINVRPEGRFDHHTGAKIRYPFHGHECLLPDELVMTSGGLKPIAEISVGESVLTHRGRFRRVTKTFHREYHGPLLGLRTTRTNGTLWITPDHPVLTQFVHGSNTEGGFVRVLEALEWTRAGDLRVKGQTNRGHYLVYPRPVESKDTDSVGFSFSWHTGHGRWVTRIADVPVDENAMVVMGYFLAEGNVNGNLVRWTFGKDLQEFLYASRVVNALARWGKRPRLYFARTSNSWVVSLSDRVLAHFFRSQFGDGAKRRRIPGWLKPLPPGKQAIFFECYVNGDGNRGKGTHGQFIRRVVTSSPFLAADIRDVALRLGFDSGIHKKSSTNEEYHVGFWDADRARRQDASFVYLLLRSIERKEYDGPVCNLEVEEDNSYCTQYHAVQLCPNREANFKRGRLGLEPLSESGLGHAFAIDYVTVA